MLGAEPSWIAASRGVTSLRPLRPVGRRSSGRVGRPAVRRFAARVGKVRAKHVVPTARSGRPPCAVRRVRHVLEPIARRVTMGGWLTCWRRCIPLTSRSHGASVQARTRSFASLTPVASLWPSPACGSSAPTSFRVGRRTALRSITTTSRSGALPGSGGTGCLRRRPAATEQAGQRSGEGRLDAGRVAALTAGPGARLGRRRRADARRSRQARDEASQRTCWLLGRFRGNDPGCDLAARG